MGRTANLDGQRRAYDLYLSGMKLADIARELNLTPNTVTSWKMRYRWGETKEKDQTLGHKLTEASKDLTAGVNIDSHDLLDQVKLSLAKAIKDGQITPKKWKDILDTLVLFTKEFAPAKKGKHVEIDITNLNDKDLDKEIEELQRITGLKEEEAIIVSKEDVSEI